MPWTHTTGRTLTAAAALALLAGTAWAQQDVTWDDQCPYAWEAVCSGGGTNWDNDQFPTPADHAIIVGAPDVRINNPSGQVVNELTLVDSKLFGGIAVFSEALLSDADFGGIFDALGPAVFSGDCTFAGTMRGPGNFDSFGTLRYNDGFIGDAVKTAELTNFGSLTLAFEPQIGEGSSIVNLGDLGFASGGIAGPGTLENAGTLSHNGPGEVFIGAPFRQTDGTVSVLAGAVRFTATSEFSGGTMSAGVGANLNFMANNRELLFNGLAEVSGEGNAVFNTGPSVGLTVESPLALNMTAPGSANVSNQSFINSTLTNRGHAVVSNARWLGSGEFVNESGATWVIPFSTSTQLNTEISLTNRGYALTAGSFAGINSAFPTVTNDPGATWDLVGGFSSLLRFDNRGQVFRREAGGEAPNYAALPRFDQTSGVITLQRAATDFVDEATWAGSSELHIESPATARVINGLLRITGDTTITTQAELFDEAGGLFAILGGLNTTQVEVYGELTLAPASIQQTETQRVRLSGGIAASGVINNLGGFEVTGTSSLDSLLNTGTFNNFSFFRTVGTLDVLLNFNNDGTVHQRGYLSVDQPGRVRNAGDWTIGPNVNLSGPTLFPFENTGNFIADPFGAGDSPGSSVSIPFDNQGAVLVRSPMTLQFTDVLQIQGGVLIGGIWIVEPGATLTFDQFPVQSIGPGATVVGGETGIPALRSISTVRGKLSLNETLNVFGGMQVEDGGVITVSDGPILITQETLTNGRPAPVEPEDPVESILDEVRSTTQVDSSLPDSLLAPALCPTTPHIVAPTFDNHAVLNPGPDGEIHALRIQADTTLHETSTLNIDLAGTSPCDQHDQLIIDGPLTVAGTIKVSFAPGYEPLPADTFTVIESTAPIAGSIDRVLSPVFANTRRLRAVVSGNTVQLEASCAADLNTDGIADSGDIQTFIPLFLAQDLAADFNADGILDLGDIQAFIAAFLEGC